MGDVMGFDSIFQYLNLTLEVFFVDLLLSGDNAIIIALACRSLPPAQMRRAMLLGTSGAIGLRVLLTAVAGLLLYVPLLKLVGGMALTIIAIKLTIAEEDAGDDKIPANKAPHLWSAVGTIIVADVVMSVDNVIALAAVSQGSIIFLAMGLLMSVPLLMYGSLFVTAVLRRYPLLIRGGGALLGWFAGDIAISDPLIANWVNQQSPGLTVVVPFLIAAFVLLESRIMETTQPTAAVLRPRRRPRPATFSAPPAALEAAPAIAVIDPVKRSAQAEAPLSLTTAKTLETPSQLEDAIGSPVSDAAPNEVEGGQPWFRSPWIPLVAISACASAYAIFVASHWIPKPAELIRYVCPGRDASIYFRHGANTVRMSSATGTITGLMHYNRITWNDGDAAAGKTLGFPPPTAVTYSDAKSVRIGSGHSDEIDCLAQLGP